MIEGEVKNPWENEEINNNINITLNLRMDNNEDDYNGV